MTHMTVRVLVSAILILGGKTNRVRCREAALTRGIHSRHVLHCVVAEVTLELRLGIAEFHAVLRALGPGDRRNHGREVEFQVFAEHRLRLRVVPQSLELGICLHQCDLVVTATGETQVVESYVIDGEHRRGRAELRAHVADGGTVGQRDFADARPVELDELPDDAVLTQDLRDGQHHVGGGDPHGNGAVQLESDDLRDEHRDRLAEHCGLGFDAADAPPENPKTVNHRGVRVGSDAGVRVCAKSAIHCAGEGHTGQVFDVHLVDDSGSGRNDLEVIERGLAPAQELVALPIALILDLDVALERVLAPEEVGDDRVVDHELGWSEGVDPVRVAAECPDSLPHRGEVDYARHAREVLHEHPGWGELDLGVWFRSGHPRAERLDLGFRDVLTVFGAEQVLEQHFQAEGELLVPRDRVHAEYLIVGRTHCQGVFRTKAIDCRHCRLPC